MILLREFEDPYLALNATERLLQIHIQLKVKTENFTSLTEYIIRAYNDTSVSSRACGKHVSSFTDIQCFFHFLS